MNKTIVIPGTLIRLENFKEIFINENYLSWLQNKKIGQGILNADPKITLPEIKQYCLNLLDSNDNYFLAIILKEEEKHIGNVRLGPIDFNLGHCRFGMMIGDTNYHGKGIGSEVVHLCTNYCFNELNINKLYLDVLESNKKGFRIYEKNNFITEKIIPTYEYNNNLYYNLKRMSITKDTNKGK